MLRGAESSVLSKGFIYSQHFACRLFAFFPDGIATTLPLASQPPAGFSFENPSLIPSLSPISLAWPRHSPFIVSWHSNFFFSSMLLNYPVDFPFVLTRGARLHQGKADLLLSEGNVFFIFFFSSMMTICMEHRSFSLTMTASLHHVSRFTPRAYPVTGC